jgi:hypothetical protein
MVRALAALTLTFLGALAAQAQEAPPRPRTIVVADVEAPSAAMTSVVTDAISEVFKAMNDTHVLRANAFDPSLHLTADGCADACVRALQQRVGAGGFVRGTAGRIGERGYVVSLAMTNLETHEQTALVSESFTGSEAMLGLAARHAARRLLALPDNGVGRVSVTAEPRASVFVDEQSRGNTPLTLADLSVGRHQLRASKEGWLDYQTELFVDPVVPADIHLVLGARPAHWYQQWWVWTIIGVAAAGATTGIVLAEQRPAVGSGSVILAAGGGSR